MEENNILELDAQQLESITGGKNKKVVAMQDDKNIRSGPGKSFAVIGKTKRGSVANFTGEKKVADGHVWLRITWGGNSGWIPFDYVEMK